MLLKVFTKYADRFFNCDLLVRGNMVTLSQIRRQAPT